MCVCVCVGGGGGGTCVEDRTGMVVNVVGRGQCVAYGTSIAAAITQLLLPGQQSASHTP